MSDIERAQRIAAMARTAFGNGAPISDLGDWCAAALSYMDRPDTEASLVYYASYIADQIDRHGLTLDPEAFSTVCLEYGRRLNQLEQ